jgi:hypothetical protein
MKVKVTVAGSAARRLADRVEIVSAAARRRLAGELTDELRSVAQSDRSVDPETRRDALDRAVRRIWGATL